MECHMRKESDLNNDKVCFLPIFYESFIVLRKYFKEVFKNYWKYIV